MRLRAEGLLLLTIAFSFALSLTETSKTSAQPKDGRPDFEVSSGNLTETQTLLTQESPRDGHGLQKRSAETFPRAPGGEEDKKQQFYEASQGVLDGRTSPDVAGKRAKKEYSGDDYCSRGWRARIEGVLNKRFLSSLSEMMGNKKASLAFGGPRGKKSRDYEGDAEEPREFLVSSGLLDEAEPGEEANERKWEEVRGDGEGVRKRSPYAFQGMRGKKEYEYELKRAMGFLGMRGKKATDVEQYKRAPQTSFFGMKGKKAQSSGFFGMRGKKDSPNGFSGIKEERQPSAFELENFTSLNQIKQSRASNSRYRRGISWLNNSKKAKNAFFGIRGKKSTPETSDK